MHPQHCHALLDCMGAILASTSFWGCIEVHAASSGQIALPHLHCTTRWTLSIHLVCEL